MEDEGLWGIHRTMSRLPTASASNSVKKVYRKRRYKWTLYSCESPEWAALGVIAAANWEDEKINSKGSSDWGPTVMEASQLHVCCKGNISHYNYSTATVDNRLVWSVQRNLPMAHDWEHSRSGFDPSHSLPYKLKARSSLRCWVSKHFLVKISFCFHLQLSSLTLQEINDRGIWSVST